MLHSGPHVEFRALSRQLATVVALNGSIDDANADSIGRRVRRFVLGDKALVLDLGGVTRCDRHVLPLLYAIDDACAEARVEWAVVVSDAVAANLEGDLPVVETLPAAFRYFAEALSARRRLVPLLSRSA